MVDGMVGMLVEQLDYEMAEKLDYEMAEKLEYVKVD